MNNHEKPKRKNSHIGHQVAVKCPHIFKMAPGKTTTVKNASGYSLEVVCLHRK